MKYHLLPLVLGMMLATGPVLPGVAQDTVFVIRLAERDYVHGGVLEEGRQRAHAWGEVLADAGLDVVITSEKPRTRQTGQPIADRLDIPIIVIPRADYDGLLERLETEFADDRVLIVSHSSSIPVILRRLGHPTYVLVPKSDYNDLFVLRPDDDGPPDVVRLNVD